MIPEADDLIRRGGLKLRCEEKIDKVKCAECGNTSHSAADWARNGNACPICSASSINFICNRCNGVFHERGLGGEHPCRSVEEFNSSGHVAFPEALPPVAPQNDEEPESRPAEPKHRGRPKRSHPSHRPSPHAPPRTPAPSGGRSDSGGWLFSAEDWDYVISAAKYAIVAGVFFGLERMVFGWCLSTNNGFISAATVSPAPDSILWASAAFLGGIWYFLPFKRATVVAVIVALVIEFLLGIAGQVIVNFDSLVARRTDHASGLSQTVAWGAFGFMFTIAMRCGEKAYDFKRWLLLCCVVAATVAFLWTWYPS